ncbi:Uncharacterized conserved protein [Ceraceosorus bombacis]|uniref:Uncharacterized conserved protein n=1 Tax=Ceraceosorus bombacis TaxID=401625 RepID=A0A0P1BEK6_9BASI|nr:Uncharacterized conserved protein [Ceraceosorus bombacis]
MSSRSNRSGFSTGGKQSSSSNAGLPSYYSQSQQASQAQSKPRLGPNRSTKATGKLKILPSEPAAQETARPRSRQSNGTAGGQNGDSSSEEEGEEDEDEADERVHKSLAQIPEGSMRRDARRLTRRARASLPRVTAYSTATSYRMRDLTRWLAARQTSHRTNPMTFDECVYTTYTYDDLDNSRGISSHPHGVRDGYGSTTTNSGAHAAPKSPAKAFGRTGDLLGIPELADEAEENRQGEAHATPYGDGTQSNPTSGTLVDSQGADKDDEVQEEERERKRFERRRRRQERFTVKGMLPEVFFMEYGTVVIWGMTHAQEKRLLREIRRFEVERLATEDVESEDLNWYLADYSRIYNDVITLRRGSSYMTKLSLSHALAQSTKISFFEGVIENTIDTTKDIPQSIADSGKIGMPPGEIMKQIGHLFILRMNIHLVGSIVDSPEIFWAQPDLEPLYSAARSYLEIPQRIDLLNARVEVLQDMLQLLKDQVTSSHSEWLEIVVIILIVLEIILGIATMFVDLYWS